MITKNNDFRLPSNGTQIARKSGPGQNVFLVYTGVNYLLICEVKIFK